MKLLLSVLVILNICAGSNVTPTGIVASRRPVLIETTTSADIAIPTSSKSENKPTKTVEASIIVDDIDETVESTDTNVDIPNPTVNPKSPDSDPATPQTTTSSPIDPTDYSTVWPTRWRPRRRFGALNEDTPRFSPNWKLIVFILISVILL